MKVRIGTRGSDLARWQANHVAERLGAEADCEIVIIETRGDAIDSKPLTQVEGKAFFTAEIERALLDGDVDLAVHSHKDLETVNPDGLRVVAVPERASAHEVLLIRPEAHDKNAALLPLAWEATVGTSAPRRRVQLHALRGDLAMADLRGNVPTRVRRLTEGRYDAIVLAAAGLERLGLDLGKLVSVPLDPALFVPAPAQGALAIQVRADDDELTSLCRRLLHDESAEAVVRAERSLLTAAGGGCHLPLGSYVARTAAGWHGLVFLGRDALADGAPSRWSEATAATPQAAVDAAWARLADGADTGVGPLAGKTIALLGSSKGGTTLGGRLHELGATIHHEQVLAFQGIRAPDLIAKLARLKPGDVLAVTSQEAARRLGKERPPRGVTVAAVGPATAKALGVLGIRPDIVGKGGARDLAARLEVRDGGTVLFPCAESARPELPDALTSRGVKVEKVVLYRTVSEATGDTIRGADVRVYMSPSAVSASVELGRETERSAMRIGLGGSTCDALQDEGLSHERPKGAGPESVVALLCELMTALRDER